jgi:Protein of unknown function (DUF4038)/Putative collagen-binding domain of a collagenase
MPHLRISENRRFLVREDGAPFFYLGDTAWELFHRLDFEQAEDYLENRAAKGFTVIQAVALAEFDGLTEPNANGDLPLLDQDPARPNEAYFEHVDRVVTRAGELGLTVGILPSWGDKVVKRWGVGPEIFTPANARVYGEFLGHRYREAAILWILGGDRIPETEAHAETWRAMAAGLAAGDGGRHLMTFHPQGGHSSAELFHADGWLAFNMLQSGHGRKDRENYRMIQADYHRSPVKPCLDGEPCYEDHPVNWKPELGWFDDYDVRKAAYWALFAGAGGHTYGCHDVWQFLSDRHPPVSAGRTPWHEALNLPGAAQMRHARELIESRPFLVRLPDQALLASDPGEGTEHVQATRGADGSYAFVYTPAGKEVTVRMDCIAGETVAAWWYNPREGTSRALGEYPNRGLHEFAPPAEGPGNDWVLVLDDAARGFPPPGVGHRSAGA